MGEGIGLFCCVFDLGSGFCVLALGAGTGSSSLTAAITDSFFAPEGVFSDTLPFLAEINCWNE